MLTFLSLLLTSCGEQVLEDTRQLPSDLKAQPTLEAAATGTSGTQDLNPATSVSETSVSSLPSGEPSGTPNGTGFDSGPGVTKNTPTPTETPPQTPTSEQKVGVDPTPTPTPAITPEPDPWGPPEAYALVKRSCLTACHTHTIYKDKSLFDLSKSANIEAVEAGRMPPVGAVPGFEESGDKDELLAFLRSLP